MDDPSWHEAKALLDWQVELGADEAIQDTPVDRYALETVVKEVAKPAPQPKTRAKPVPPPVPEVDAVAVAKQSAGQATTINALQDALAAYEHCELKRGARNLVFADGTFGADLMVVGEAPGRDEDLAGKPFVGRAGQLLDKMLAAIQRDRAKDVYITNVLPWRPPQNRDPKPEEIAMMGPFLQKHIALAEPKVLIIMGNIACQALLGRIGITRLRGTWAEAHGIEAMPMFHPAYLLRNPIAKREAWSDLIAVRSKLAEQP